VLLHLLSLLLSLGLYNERAGTINIVVSRPETVAAVSSQLKMVIRANYSNPPAHGARVVATILSDKALFEEWSVGDNPLHAVPRLCHIEGIACLRANLESC
jgi:aspartate/tyrosine/aromatic aminotransferase